MSYRGTITVKLGLSYDIEFDDEGPFIAEDRKEAEHIAHEDIADYLLGHLGVTEIYEGLSINPEMSL